MAAPIPGWENCWGMECHLSGGEGAGSGGRGRAMPVKSPNTHWALTV